MNGANPKRHRHRLISGAQFVIFHALRPDITLRIYAHLFRKDDGKAAAAINAILGP